MITSPCPRPQKQKQAKTITATTQIWKHTSINRPTIAGNKSNKKKINKKERKKKQTDK